MSVANTKPYPFFSKGDGVYNPISQWPLRHNQGNLKPSISAQLYKKTGNIRLNDVQGRNWKIKAVNPSSTTSSYFGQYGRGRPKQKPKPSGMHTLQADSLPPKKKGRARARPRRKAKYL